MPCHLAIFTNFVHRIFCLICIHNILHPSCCSFLRTNIGVVFMFWSGIKQNKEHSVAEKLNFMFIEVCCFMIYILYFVLCFPCTSQLSFQSYTYENGILIVKSERGVACKLVVAVVRWSLLWNRADDINNLTFLGWVNFCPFSLLWCLFTSVQLLWSAAETQRSAAGCRVRRIQSIMCG